MSPWQLFCQQVRFICRKELLAIWKDKAFRYVLVIPTLVLGVVFGYTATFNVENVTYAVLDQSHSEASTSLLPPWTAPVSSSGWRISRIRPRSRNPLIRKM